MESKTLTFDWRVDGVKRGQIEVWFREYPELIERNTPDAAVSALFGSVPVGVGRYEIAYPNGPPQGLRFKLPAGVTVTRWKPREKGSR